jgi:hypothetical protein
MGQPIAVTRQQSSRPGIVRLEANRTLTGMGHERFRSADEAHGPRPAAELARRLFATGHVDAVHVHGNIVTVDVAKGSDGAGFDDVLRDLYQYWQPGMEPPSFDDLVAEDEAASSASPAASGGEAGDAALSEAAKRVPAHLLERSRQARERWKAKRGA